MKTIHVCLLPLLLLMACQQKQSVKTPTNNKIETLLAQMTLAEKAGQLNLLPFEGELTEEQKQLVRDGKVGSLLKSNGVARNREIQRIAVEETRLGIPILFQEDVIHGYKTIAPVPLAEAASWDLEAIRNSAAIAAREAAAAGIHLTYAPMVDICRDPRWGRILEAAGEDPYLGSLVAAARVKGFQESNDSLSNILACVKHYAGYGAALAGRDYNIQDFSERELRELHLPPFQAAVDAGVASVMCAYTAYDGVPLCANRYLLHDVLRKEMEFQGLIMTDWSTITNLIGTGVAADDTAAVKMTIDAGIDMDMTSGKYEELLPAMVEKGLVSMEQVDNAVRQVLMLKDKVGLLDDPYAYLDEARETSELFSERNYAETKELAMKSMVLLKNEGDVLPLNKKTKRIALIGPFAKAARDLNGWWACMGQDDQITTIYKGLQKKLGDKASLSYAKGCDINRFEMAGTEKIPQAVQVAKAADVVVLVLGEEHWMSGEGGGTASIRLPGAQQQLLNALVKTGKPIVTLVVTGKPYVLTDVAAKTDALLQVWMPGSTAGDAVADILAGDFNPCGKLPVTFPCHEGQVPIFYNHKRTSHGWDAGPSDNRYTTTHRDVQSEPLYPFGYGLSYTTFEYSEIELSDSVLTDAGTLTARISVTNSGEVAGREVVQLYLRDEVCSVIRPFKELKDFTLVDLEAGETRELSFEITPAKLQFIDRNYQVAVEPGSFRLFIGGSSADTREAGFTLRE